ncbi:MAG: HAMP domain-containing sensor histidine kinase [Pseudomonadota bacterium]
MENKKPVKSFGSLFGKLLIIIVLTGFCINLLVAGFFFHFLKTNYRDPYIRNAANYINYLVQDIGTPPSFERAKKIADSFQLIIAYKNPEQSWSTSKSSIALQGDDHWQTIFAEKDVIIKTLHGRKQIHVYRDSGQFTFTMESDYKHTVQGYIRMVVLIILLTLVLCLSYFSIRWVLRPVKWLQEGVNQVGKGNLDHVVQAGRSDELGRLAKAFNAMTERIRSMLRDRDQLLLDVSHELRTPLTRMKVALEFLPKGQAERNIREDALEMESMITAILEEARLHHVSEKLQKKQIDLRALILDILREYRDQQPPITADIPEKGSVLEIEPELIKIALRNLLNNAIKYSEPDGPPIKLKVVQGEKQVKLQIQDCGIGIPADDLPHIFEPFYRVDKSRSRRTGGYGIGLRLCKSIMDAHNGKIEVISAFQKGSTFTMIFKKPLDR